MKWLDLKALCGAYLQSVRNAIGKRVDLAEIHYFSARPDFLIPTKPDTVERFDRYMTALRYTGVQVNIPREDGMVWLAYQRWLGTQGHKQRESWFSMDGWLFEIRELHKARAPGNTCLSALASGSAGTPNEPLNNSKGCGGVMRVAPVALWRFQQGGTPQQSFELGAGTAALTHGHASGFLAAGCMAATIHMLLSGATLGEAIDGVIPLLAISDHDARECIDAIEKACALAREGTPTPEKVESLGAGW